MDSDLKRSVLTAMKRVYSIWICMNICEDCMEYIRFTRENILGTYHWKGDIDLLNIIFIGLAEDIPKKEKGFELHRLLGVLFSTKLGIKEKFYILKYEFGIELEDGIGRDVNDMCNLGEGIREKALAEGLSKGEAKGRILGISEGRAMCIIELLGFFNERIPNDIIETIQKEKDNSILTKWTKDVARSSSLDEFIQMM